MSGDVDRAVSMPVATQNKITRSCALSVVVSFSMACQPRSRGGYQNQ
jgi:hypothetical protein